MNQAAWMFPATVVYFIIFVWTVGGIFLWRIKRRRERPPVPFKLLRGPGESLRRRIHKFDEDALLYFGGAAMVPLLTGLGVLGLLSWLTPHMPLSVGLTLVGAAVLTLTLVTGRWALRLMMRARDDMLGYLGERAVAEFLEPLRARGYRVFHDVPAEGALKDFNLDHVTIGPTGAAVIETKTRRKGRARPGMQDHVVTYDGKQLLWPWGEDRYGLDQANAEADWLRKWINERTGLEIPVKPILALPGWWVEVSGRGVVTVVNHKNVARAVEGNGPRLLSEQQIDLIARQLDDRCRDVEE
jgi:hypothetical protein